MKLKLVGCDLSVIKNKFRNKLSCTFIIQNGQYTIAPPGVNDVHSSIT